MEFSDGEKLIITMLCEIYKHFDIKSDLEPEFIEDAIHSGHPWGLKWEYPGLFNTGEVSEATASEVVEVLQMWMNIELSYSELSDADQLKVKAEATSFDVTFRGFDGNNEDQYGVALFLINKLGRFEHFKGRSLNAHSRTMDLHRRMLRVYESIISSSHTHLLTPDQLIELLKSQAYRED